MTRNSLFVSLSLSYYKILLQADLYTYYRHILIQNALTYHFIGSDQALLHFEEKKFQKFSKLKKKSMISALFDPND